MDKTTNTYFKNTRAPPAAENETEFVLVKYILSICFIIHVFTSTYRNINKLASEILKRNISGKQEVEEAPRTEGGLKPKIQEKEKLNPKNLLVYYAYVLPPITKIRRVKNECYPFSNKKIGTI